MTLLLTAKNPYSAWLIRFGRDFGKTVQSFLIPPEDDRSSVEGRSSRLSLSGIVRLFSHSLIRVEAVLVRLPGESFVNLGHGISSNLLESRFDSCGPGATSVELWPVFSAWRSTRTDI